MKSRFKAVNKGLETLEKEREKLIKKREGLKAKIEEKYPWELYGVTGEMLFDEKAKDLDEEIAKLQTYISGYYDLIEILEGRSDGTGKS